ncbi:MAG TPA: MFS transporter [Stellaceae bacterium]|nr:MFS transporter [Stellaceae bacterium]
MKLFDELRQLDGAQRRVVTASFLGWTLDAFDFFILVFVIGAIADDFHTAVADIAYAITLTLAMRPLGALIFGWFADRYGRRPTMMVDVLLYSLFELASAFAPSLATLLVLRALFGIAMGGEWGIGSSLAMESIPAKSRGIVSGLLQEGYAVGYLIAAIVYWAVFPWAGWRGMFAVGVIPALLVLYIRRGVEESPVWKEQAHTSGMMWRSIKEHAWLFIYVIVLMACFNAFSHGTQDLYPTFLKQQHGFSTAQISTLTIIANLGAIAGGILFGAWSEQIGRKRAIVLAALGSLPIAYLWAYSSGMVGLAVGAFLMQFMVQGAWGIVPVHLNELSPGDIRGTFPGFTYQLGNLVISLLAPYQAKLAAAHGNDYSFALALTAVIVAVLIIIVISLGRERRGVAFTQSNAAE